MSINRTFEILSNFMLLNQQEKKNKESIVTTDCCIQWLKGLQSDNVDEIKTLTDHFQRIKHEVEKLVTLAVVLRPIAGQYFH